MAYIPDDAVDRMTELSAGAWRLYCFLARCRNQKTGKCCPSVRVTMDTIGTKRSQTYQFRKELVRAGWATFDGNNVTALFGFDSPAYRTTNDSNKEVTENSPKSRKIPKSRTGESEIPDKTVRNPGLLYKEEPAKENQQIEPSMQQQRESRFSPEQITAYIKATKQHVYSVSGLTRYLKSNGEEDELIAKWFESEELKEKLKAKALEDAANLEQTFDWDGWTDNLIYFNDRGKLEMERAEIEKRGGPKEPWEFRVYEYLNAATEAA